MDRYSLDALHEMWIRNEYPDTGQSEWYCAEEVDKEIDRLNKKIEELELAAEAAEENERERNRLEDLAYMDTVDFDSPG